ncbi:MAG: VTT domain-containing protein [Burkholderiaceae bacterium]
MFGLLAALWVGLPLSEWLVTTHRYILEAGYPGIAAFVAAYVVAVIVFAPATVFTLSAGALWGWWGVPIALAGAWLGSLAAFFLARRFAGRHVGWLCHQHEAADRMNRIIEHLGWRGVLLSRLSPLVPFSLQNYLFGMSRVNATQFAWAGLIGMLPATLVKIWVGVAGVSVGSHGTGAIAIGDPASWPTYTLIGIGTLATVWVARLFVQRWQQA